MLPFPYLSRCDSRGCVALVVKLADLASKVEMFRITRNRTSRNVICLVSSLRLRRQEDRQRLLLLPEMPATEENPQLLLCHRLNIAQIACPCNFSHPVRFCVQMHANLCSASASAQLLLLLLKGREGEFGPRRRVFLAAAAVDGDVGPRRRGLSACVVALM